MAPANVVKTGRDEHLWTKAKAQAKKEYPDVAEGSDRFYKIVMGIYKKMHGDGTTTAKGAAECPGGKIRSEGRGQGLGRGEGKGPIGKPRFGKSALVISSGRLLMKTRLGEQKPGSTYLKREGRPGEYKYTYKEKKEEGSKVNIDSLLEIGGREWKSDRDDKHRVYFNNLVDLFGRLEVERYKTGGISYAKFDGEEISNTKAKEIVDALNEGKLWYDVNAGKFYYQLSDRHCRTVTSDEMATTIIREIKKRVGDKEYERLTTKVEKGIWVSPGGRLLMKGIPRGGQNLAALREM